MIKSKTPSAYKWIIFSFVLLFNPNISVIDPLPDFFAWFILSGFLTKAADCAPYFQEAKTAFTRLGWLNLVKIPALSVVSFIRSQNTLDNDVMALASFTFAAIEVFLLVSATKYIFEAFFYLGERTDTNSFISPFATNKSGTRMITPEALRDFCYFFSVCKCLFYFLPDLFLLTRVDKNGQVFYTSPLYPIVLIISIILGFVIGGIWLGRIKKYIKAILDEKSFDDTLEKICPTDERSDYSRRKKLRSLSFALTMLAASSFFSLELIFDNFGGINILPHFIYGGFVLFAFVLLSRHVKRCPITLISSLSYVIISTICYVFSVIFLSKYEYYDLTRLPEAKAAYLPVIIFSVLEFAALSLTFIFIARFLKKFILENTGLNPDSERYMKMEKEYHTSLIKRAYVLSSMAIISGLAKLVNVFLNNEVQLIYSDINDVTKPVFTGSLIPWFNVVVTFTAIIYIGYSLYYISTLKEEVEIKYSYTQE